MKKSDMFFLIFIILLIIVLVIVIYYASTSRKDVKDMLAANAVKEEKTDIEVYFCPEEMCQEHILDLIRGAKEIKCAFYELNLPDIISALKEKGAEVVIEDSTYKNGSGFYTGFSEALMHNKFCVFDSKTIYAGSMNPTVNDNYYNNNNIVIMSSEALARNYLDEFAELKNNIYGRGESVKSPDVFIGDIEVENYFCPEDNCKLHILNALKSANQSIYFMTFSFTDDDLGNIIYNKHQLGLETKGIFEQQQISDFAQYEKLKNFSIIDKNDRKLHHKVFIIDNNTVVTGSFNPTGNANERNDENVLIIHDKAIAQKYFQEFEKQYNFQDSIPNVAQEVVLAAVLYDPKGSDEKNEKVILKNIGSMDEHLDYYSISDNKTDMRLFGMIMPGETREFTPKMPLKNKNGYLYLRHNAGTVDFVAWDGMWRLKAPAGHSIIRADFTAVSENAWSVG